MLHARFATAARSFAVAGRRTAISLPRNAQLQSIMFVQQPRFGSSQNRPKSLNKDSNDINIIDESMDDSLLRNFETWLKDEIKSDVQNDRMQISEFSHKLHVPTRIQLSLTRNCLKSLEKRSKEDNQALVRRLESQVEDLQYDLGFYEASLLLMAVWMFTWTIAIILMAGKVNEALIEKDQRPDDGDAKSPSEVSSR